MSVVDQFIGEWKLVKSENFEDFLKASGVNFMLRKMIGMAKPKLTYTKLGEGSYRILMSTPMKDRVQDFQLDVPFKEQRMDGVNCTCIFKAEGNTLVQTMTDEKGVATIITRELINGEMVITYVIGDVKCVRTFARS